MAKISFSVFTKPWMKQSPDELGHLMSSFGFDGIEFPLRAGYQVAPEDAEKGLPALVYKMSSYGLKVFSVASSLEENIFAGCADAGIPVIRIMAPADLKAGYAISIEKHREKINAALPFCRKYGIRIGIQNHCGPGVNNSMELRQFLTGYDPQEVCAIWDAAHSALAGEEPEQGLEIVWPHLYMVNLKNAFYNRSNGPEAENAVYKRYFTSGRQGMASWPRVTAFLKNSGYAGIVCLTAEYTDTAGVDRLIAEDLKYARSLFER